MLNLSSSTNLKPVALSCTITTLVFTFLTILFDVVLVVRLISFSQLKKRLTKRCNHSIGLTYSINTYIHIIGETTVFFLMAIRTLYGDLHFQTNEEDAPPSWHCRLLNYLMTLFASGIYGSCFLQSLFRYWRVMKASNRRYLKYSFHIQFISLHWALIFVLSIPVWFRSVYLSGENYCLNRFVDTYASLYISMTSMGIPATGMIAVYLKIVLFMKHHWQSRKRCRRMKRDILIIRRIIILVFVLLFVSTAVIILWLLMFIQKRLHPLSYRLLCLIIATNMPICSITLLIVTPQLKRAFLFSNALERPANLPGSSANRE